MGSDVVFDPRPPPYRDSDPKVYLKKFNEQVAYKRGWPGQKNGDQLLPKWSSSKGLGYHLCFGHRLLAIVCDVFL